MKEEFFGRNLNLNFLLTRTHFFKTKSVRLSWNIFVSKFIFGYRKSSFIFFFDLFSIFFFVRRALNFIESISRLNLIIFCHSPEFIDKRKSFKNFFIFNKWIKGFLTSFLFIESLNLSSLPSALISLNTRKHNEIFISEAFNLNIPTIGLFDITSFNLNAFSYLIPSNYTLENQLFYLRLFLRSYIIGYKTNLLDFFENVGLNRFRFLVDKPEKMIKEKEYAFPEKGLLKNFKVLSPSDMDNFYKFKVFLLNPTTSIFKNDFIYKLDVSKKKVIKKQRILLNNNKKFLKFHKKNFSVAFANKKKRFLYPFFFRPIFSGNRKKSRIVPFKNYFVNSAENLFDFSYRIRNFSFFDRRKNLSSNFYYDSKLKLNTFVSFLFKSNFTKYFKANLDLNISENVFYSLRDFTSLKQFRPSLFFSVNLNLFSNYNLVDFISFVFLRKEITLNVFWKNFSSFLKSLFLKFYFYFLFKRDFLLLFFNYENTLNVNFTNVSLMGDIFLFYIDDMRKFVVGALRRVFSSIFFFIKLVFFFKFLKFIFRNKRYSFFLKNWNFFFFFNKSIFCCLKFIFFTVFNSKLFNNFYILERLQGSMEKDSKKFFLIITGKKTFLRTQIFNLLIENRFLQLEKN